jgi:hypothetical protein
VTKIAAAKPGCRNFAARLAFHLLSQTVTCSRQISARCHLLFADSELKAATAIVLRPFKRYESPPMAQSTTESHAE